MRTALLIAALLCLASPGFATWSVIAIDQKTGQVAIASASCVDDIDDGMRDAIAVVVPGKGVAACQAAVDRTHQNHALVFQEMQKGTDPHRIIEMLSADPQFQSRQFGIVDIEGRAAGHSGLLNSFETLFVPGHVPDTGVYYQVLGNTIRSGAIRKGAQAFVEASGSLTDRVMAAMESIDANGGDVRCSCPPAESKPALPCDNKHAHAAYILLANPADSSGSAESNGKYAMYIGVTQPAPGRAQGAKPGESLNPIKTLRIRYDAWRKNALAN
ncbi:MAG: DUF1028 domain-containing protein [Acidobacteriia bacterium]|nr:DUF1028 domain-containing protein [Terriglobia bacterium]